MGKNKPIIQQDDQNLTEIKLVYLSRQAKMALVKMQMKYTWNGEEYVYKARPWEIFELFESDEETSINILAELICNNICTMQPDAANGMVIFRLQYAFLNTQISLN